LDLGGVQTGSGTVYFDAIEMVNTGGSSASPETWARANSLGTGVNTSNWLEAYWLIPFGTYPELNKYTRAKVRALNTAGFQTFRLPIIVERLAETSPPYTIDFAHTAFKLVDSMILWADLYDFKLIIDNHHGYSLTNSNFSSEIPRLRAIWGQMIDRYDYLDPEQFFFEVYNEPTPDISNANWRTVAAAVLDEIRDHESQTHSVFVGANSWNSGSSLVSFTPLDDPDIIYTFHCYDPYLFTHQGMSWTSPPNLPARSFPLAGEVAAINALMASVDDWSTEYDVPANLGEFGCSTSADATSRCNWVQTMADAFNPYSFSNFYWDAITPSDAFGFFNNGIIDQAHVIPCFKDALGLYSTPAPIELTHFDIICQQENAVLHWSSYTLGKGYVFGIESSMDGKKWSTIKTIPAVEGQQNYQFEDTQSGQLYRLSMLAPNGHQHYSGIRNSACREAFASVRVFPNPAVNQAILEVQQSDVSLAEVTLSDLAGRILWQVNIGSNDEIRQLSLPVSALPAGKYLLSGRTTDGILWHTPVTVTK
jgi:endoglucanase